MDEYRKYGIFKDRRSEFIEYCETYGKFPGDDAPGLRNWARDHKHDPIILQYYNKLVDKSHITNSIDRTQELIEFIQSKNRLPKSNIKSEKSLYNWMRSNRDNKLIDNIWTTIRSQKSYNRLQDLIEFTQINNRLPISDLSNVYENSLYYWMNSHRYDPEVSILIKKFKINYHKVNFELKLNLLKNFIKDNWRLPCRYGKTELESTLYHFIGYYKNDCQVKDLIDSTPKIDAKSVNSLEELREFVLIYHRFPKSSDGKRMYEIYRRYSNHWYIKKLMTEYNLSAESHYHQSIKSRDLWIKEFIEFCGIYDRLPSKYSKNESESKLGEWASKHKSLPEIVSLYEKYPKRVNQFK